MSGSYIAEVRTHAYDNPSGRCDGCQPGLDPGCCDETTVRPADEQCPDSPPTCDPLFRFRYCDVDTANACDEVESTFSSSFAINSSRVIVNTNFPVIVEKSEPWNVSF